MIGSLLLAIMILIPERIVAQEAEPTSPPGSEPVPGGIAASTGLVRALNSDRSRLRAEGVRIDSHRGGEAIQGQVIITGSTAIDGFFSAELSFTYTGDPTRTWFLIAENFTPVVDGPLAEWDTFNLTDGNYDLRLLVTLLDGSQHTFVVEGIRVRNYSPIETSTPTNTPTITPTPIPRETPASTATNTPTITPTPTETPIPPTPTPLPTNPARLPIGNIANGLARGAAGAMVIFLLLGTYTSFHRVMRR
ncbi:MAG: hypothetical protein ACE5GO_11770 [Anaerolineales bacterium]